VRFLLNLKGYGEAEAADAGRETMEQSDKDRQLTRRLLLIGTMLVKGPQVLYPKNGDGHLYLEKSVSITWAGETRARLRSVHIYCDANGSDEEGYLTPLVRFASWNRYQDLFELRPTWPNVIIEMAELPIDSAELQSIVEGRQTAVGRLPFAAKGLATRRNFGEWPEGHADVLTIRLASGWQELERRLFVCESQALYETARKAESQLRRIGVSLEQRLWDEVYDHGPEDLMRDTSWRWNGQSEEV
jgi:hypothetical protein